MGTLLEFPKKEGQTSLPLDKVLFEETPEVLLSEWIARNKVISEEFHKHSVYQKQDILDTVLRMCDDLYEMNLKLKGKLK